MAVGARASKMPSIVSEFTMVICKHKSDATARAARLTSLLIATVCLCAPQVQARRLSNPVAVFAGLDKVTARTSKFGVPLDETVRFGTLKVTPRVCYSSPATEKPKTTTFVEVDEVMLDGSEKRVFSGWMFAESPGLNAVEHPVFDVWLTGCLNPNSEASTSVSPLPRNANGDAIPADQVPRKRRRVRR
jgi:hypothetical protein